MLSRGRSSEEPAEFASCVVCRGRYSVGDVSPSVCSPERGTPTQLVSVIAEDDVITPVGETIGSSDAVPDILPPPPGFSQFSWPFDDWSVSNEQSRFAVNVDSPDVIAGRPGVEPSLQLSPITPV